MKNSTNIIKYKFLSPIYDLFFRSIFSGIRMKAFESINIKPDSKVLLVGVGTGEDLKFLPDECHITGIDISQAMLSKAVKKSVGKKAEFIVMNGEKLDFNEESFDYIILNLILSVVENPRNAMSEAVRVLKTDGKILVFDKFVSRKIAYARKIFNILTSLLGTDITRNFEDIIQGIPVKILKQDASLFKGSYKIILLGKL
ncbi:MAG: class I SAM-dependent methyltransferase [Bacillota bacterium]